MRILKITQKFDLALRMLAWSMLLCFVLFFIIPVEIALRLFFILFLVMMTLAFFRIALENISQRTRRGRKCSHWKGKLGKKVAVLSLEERAVVCYYFSGSNMEDAVGEMAVKGFAEHEVRKAIEKHLRLKHRQGRNFGLILLSAGLIGLSLSSPFINIIPNAGTFFLEFFMITCLITAVFGGLKAASGAMAGFYGGEIAGSQHELRLYRFLNKWGALPFLAAVLIWTLFVVSFMSGGVGIFLEHPIRTSFALPFTEITDFVVTPNGDVCVAGRFYSSFSVFDKHGVHRYSISRPGTKGGPLKLACEDTGRLLFCTRGLGITVYDISTGEDLTKEVVAEADKRYDYGCWRLNLDGKVVRGGIEECEKELDGMGRQRRPVKAGEWIFVYREHRVDSRYDDFKTGGRSYYYAGPGKGVMSYNLPSIHYRPSLLLRYLNLYHLGCASLLMSPMALVAWFIVKLQKRLNGQQKNPVNTDSQHER